MDEVTKLTLLTLIVAILALIITIMTIQEGRLRLLFQITLSLITCYGILNVVAFVKNESLYIWSLEEYNPCNIRIFYHKMFWKCILFSFISWLFFYVGLRLLISKMFGIT